MSVSGFDELWLPAGGWRVFSKTLCLSRTTGISFERSTQWCVCTLIAFSSKSFVQEHMFSVANDYLSVQYERKTKYNVMTHIIE